MPVRLNEEEATRLDKICRKKGLARSSYLRTCLLDCLSRDERVIAKAEEN